MKRIPIALLLLIVISSFSVKKNKSWFAGVWEGTGIQPDANYQHWSIRAVLDPMNDVYTIDYPSLNCGGTWKLKRSNRRSAEFHESIETGKDKCVAEGKVVLTKVDADHIKYEYYLESTGSLDSYGDLTRSN